MTIAIMAVLIFGVAASPVLSNGFAFAQTNSTENTEKEKKEQRSDESKQQKADQTANAEAEKQTSIDKKEISKEKHAKDSEKKQEKRTEQQEKRTAAQELQEQRRAELEERNLLLMERLSTQEKIDRERMQERMDSMKERSQMTEAMDRLTDAGVLESVESVQIDDLGEILVPRNTNEENIPFDRTSKYFDKLRETIADQKRQQEILFTQMSVLLNLVDSMCEDKVLVAGVSDGALRCIDSDRAFNLHSRGMVTLVQ